MKRFITGSIMILSAAACSDSTSSGPIGASAASRSVAESVQPNAASNNLFAVVNISGGLISGNRVASVSHLGTGRYEVTFNASVTGCAYIATTTNAYSQALGIYTAGGHLSGNGVYVETKNQGGGLTDGPFHLWVACDGTSIQYAVVGYSANLVRQSGSTTMTYLGAGRYNIRFPSAVNKCGFVATVADPAAGLVFSPSGVYTASGSDANSVYIETKNPGGGLQDAVPFHLAVLCPGAPKTGFVIVRSNGTPARGAPPGGSTARTAVGSYTVTSPFNISACAKVATRGSENTGAPFNPTTVEMVNGTTINNFSVQVRELLFFGGSLFDETFHTAIIC
ncbi:MAG: hypothetical protein ABI877_17265 [Gemmatimonadaceae bacterium]